MSGDVLLAFDRKKYLKPSFFFPALNISLIVTNN